MSGSRASSARLCWALPALLLGSCSLHRLEGALGVGTSVSGELLLRDAAEGEILLRPEACLSGDRGNFRGVDLLTPSLIVRLVAEPIEGLAVALIDSASGERRGIFRRSDCRLLRGDVQRTGWSINNVADVKGFVELECGSASEQEIAGSIVFEHCH